jgi:hypothetical protein
MANMFEKPIAANPMSEFVALPMQFLDQAVQRRQAKYDQAKAEIELERDKLLGTQSLAGDKDRHRKILADFEQGFDDIADSVGGDYSLVGAQLDVYKRRVKQDMAYGELGAIHKAYGSALKEREELDKAYADSKIGYGGYQEGLKTIAGYKTRRNEDGSWSQFQGYTPSNIVNVTKVLQDSVDEINAKYRETGEKEITRENILANINNIMMNNPNIEKAIMENFKALYAGKPEEFESTYKAFRNKTVEGVVSDKRYEEAFKETDASGHKKYSVLQGTTSSNWQLPRTSGTSGYIGGSANLLKAGAKYLGFSTDKEHNDYVNSAEGKRTISALENSTGTKYPAKGSYYEQSQWMIKNIDKNHTATLEFGPIDPTVGKNVITDEGFLNFEGAIYNKAGKVLSGDERKAIQGKSEKGNTARVIGVVTKGGTYPVGSYYIRGVDGEEYIQEPSDPKTLGSSAFNIDQINSVRYMNTAEGNVTLRGNVTSTDGKVTIPMGNYKVQYDEKEDMYKMFKDGKLAFVKKIVEVNGIPQEIISSFK